MRFFLASAAALFIAAPAEAEWRQASTQHFLIYSEQSPQSLQRFGEELERFDQAVRLVRGMHDQPASLGNRVTIFEVSLDTLKALDHDRTGFIRGFYTGSVAGSVAFVTHNGSTNFQIRTGEMLHKADITEMHADTVLLHEYSHHLMFEDLTTPYPKWLVEGFAEFMSTAEFKGDGSVAIGKPALHRYMGLVYGDQLSLDALFAGNFEKITEQQLESVYGKGWLLTHYLTFEPSRKGQLEGYIAAISRGVDPVQAAHQAFGDFTTLQHELDKYFTRSKLLYLSVPAKDLKPAAVQVTSLSPGASAMLPVLMWLNSGLQQNSEGLAAAARKIEQQFPRDPLVETTLAQADLKVKDAKGAQAAAERALAADPNSTEAMILEGRAEIEQLTSSGGSGAAFDQARTWYLKANKLDPESPQPLYQFYQSYVAQKIAPTQNAIAALHYASDLAPQDLNVRVQSAGLYLTEGKLKEARVALVPVAFNPHGEKESAIARQMITDIDAGNASAALAVAGWKLSAEKGS